MIVHPMVWGGAIYNVLVEGGDRWFVYVLMWVFAISLPLRKIVKTDWIWIVIIFPVAITLYHMAPTVFLLDLTMKYIPFFIIGMYLSNYFEYIKTKLADYFYYIVVTFVVFNIVLVTKLSWMPCNPPYERKVISI